MILRRLALFVALPRRRSGDDPACRNIAEQYRQRLGGAIDALAAVVARFDSDSQQQGLTEQGGIDRLRANTDPFVRGRGTQMQDSRRASAEPPADAEGHAGCRPRWPPGDARDPV